MKKWTMMGLATLVMAFGLIGCTQEAQQKYGEAGDAAGKAAEKTGDAVATDAEKTGEAVAAGAANAAETVKDTAEKTGEVVTDATITAKVKNALLSANDLNTSDLDVDTADNVVHLKGSVKSQAEKDRAMILAKALVGKNMTVKNELTVKP